MIACPSCSSQIPDSVRFCPECGEAVSSVSQLPTNLASPSVEAAARKPASSSRVGRLASSDSIDAGGFTPGAILADRYRIIGLLGRGGMGEVYRADDLKLGQPVALKFLPNMLSQDPARLERFYAEVRIARQVSHPNVCRVYDVGEVEGQHYLSMEFVDGEDLASLLRRIGRLPPDKALDIAREICAGLAAAHDKGVLHRDLKPANIMIDGRGRARITDFGLAVAVGETTEGEISGTPAYMAPEQLAGKGASVKTDIYSLGLVLYELYTGKKAFDGASFQELKRKHSEDAPASPSTVAPGFDPVVERVILRCLEKDPGRRPFSVSHVAAALPGGDPLAAAIAAGETPSPEMVAAAGEEGALAPARAWALLSGVLAVVLAVVLFARYSTDVGLAPLPKSPDALYDRAREIVQKLGYSDHPADTAFWWERQYGYLQYRAAHIPSPRRVRELGQDRPHPLWFWYRQSPRSLIPANGDRDVRLTQPPLEVSGMVALAMDAGGNLVSFRAVPPQVDDSKGPRPDPDWSALFAAAGLDPARFTSSTPGWLPPVPFDSRADWEGAYSGQPDVPIRVTAAAYHGKPVSFEVLGPWSRPARMQETSLAGGAIARGAAIIFMVLSVLIAAVFIARRNLRLGRGDRRGALRVSVFVFAMSMLSWALSAHHVADLQGEFEIFFSALARSVADGALVWVAYIAIEPIVRRKWPNLLISWSRLLAGRFRDPLVGRDALIGIGAGAAFALAISIDNGLAYWFDLPGMTPEPESIGALAGIAGLLSNLADVLAQGALRALVVMSLLVLSQVLLRRKWLAIAASGCLLTLLSVSGENIAVELPMAILIAALVVVVAARYGILALAFVYFSVLLIQDAPRTLDFSRWYAGRSLFLVGVIAALAFAAFRIALGGRSAFGAASLEES